MSKPNRASIMLDAGCMDGRPAGVLSVWESVEKSVERNSSLSCHSLSHAHMENESVWWIIIGWMGDMFDSLAA